VKDDLDAVHAHAVPLVEELIDADVGRMLRLALAREVVAELNACRSR
jgi:hypothetical protein